VVFLWGELLLVTVGLPNRGCLGGELRGEDFVSLECGFKNAVCFVVNDLGEIKGDESKFFLSKSSYLIVGTASCFFAAHVLVDLGAGCFLCRPLTWSTTSSSLGKPADRGTGKVEGEVDQIQDQRKQVECNEGDHGEDQGWG